MSGSDIVRVGLLGEMIALAALRRKGMKLVCRRYRGGSGEIDLVMQDGKTLVFTEVKYRPMGRVGDGLHAVMQDKRRRLRSAAAHYLAAHPGQLADVRFDCVEVTRAGIRHVKNAF
ncbi:MAG: YraN family protein [Clostridiales bacterium]|nr:YraN family protein [Clostridiales bacterium]